MYPLTWCAVNFIQLCFATFYKILRIFTFTFDHIGLCWELKARDMYSINLATSLNFC